MASRWPAAGLSNEYARWCIVNPGPALCCSKRADSRSTRKRTHHLTRHRPWAQMVCSEGHGLAATHAGPPLSRPPAAAVAVVVFRYEHQPRLLQRLRPQRYHIP